MNVQVDAAVASELLADWFVDVGLPRPAAKSVGDHVVAAEVVGRPSHGLRLAPRIARIARSAPPTALHVSVDERELGTMAIDAHGLPGVHALDKAVEYVLGCHETGRGTVAAGVTGFGGSTGCLGLFAHRLACDGATNIVMSTSRSIMAPPGTATPILGTNAIAFGAPVEAGQPIVGDLAASTWSYGQVALARERSEQVPAGIVLDDSGRPSTDPDAVVQGSLVPSGGHKGWVIAMLVEVLAGALVGGKVGDGPGGESVLMVSFRADVFSDGTDRAVASLVEQLRSAVAVSGDANAHVPGGRFEELDGSHPMFEVSARTLERIVREGGPKLGD